MNRTFPWRLTLVFSDGETQVSYHQAEILARHAAHCTQDDYKTDLLTWTIEAVESPDGIKRLR